jgi:hypothetical protein
MTQIDPRKAASFLHVETDTEYSLEEILQKHGYVPLDMRQHAARIDWSKVGEPERPPIAK